MKEVEIDGINIKLGQTAQENWELVKNSNSNYVWIHLKSFPSGHVLIEDNNPSKIVLQVAMELCLNHTKQKNMKHVYASVTTISNLKSTEKVGEVDFKSNRKVQSVKIN
jgi:hypothetical protein